MGLFNARRGKYHVHSNKDTWFCPFETTPSGAKTCIQRQKFHRDSFPQNVVFDSISLVLAYGIEHAVLERQRIWNPERRLFSWTNSVAFSDILAAFPPKGPSFRVETSCTIKFARKRQTLSVNFLVDLGCQWECLRDKNSALTNRILPPAEWTWTRRFEAELKAKLGHLRALYPGILKSDFSSSDCFQLYEYSPSRSLDLPFFSFLFFFFFQVKNHCSTTQRFFSVFLVLLEESFLKNSHSSTFEYNTG